MVTSTQISNYLDSIYEAQSIYADKIIKKERLGNKNNLIQDRVNLTLLVLYVDIMVAYFSQALYDGNGFFITTYNFFEVNEIEDIMYRIDMICDTGYSLTLD